MKTIWKKNLPAAMVPADLSAWMGHKGSFMQRLKKFGVNTAKIEVLKQSWHSPTADESTMLNIKPRQFVLVREVLIASPEGMWMFARTVMPRMTLTGTERQLAFLKNRSLGSVLFKDPHLQRSEFELACLRQGSAGYEKIIKLLSLEASELWARRSMFHIKNKPLLLTEIFFPDVAALKNVNA